MMRVSRLVVSVSTARTGQVRPLHVRCLETSATMLSAQAWRSSAVSMRRKDFWAIQGFFMSSTLSPSSFLRNTLRMSLGSLGLAGFLTFLASLTSPSFFILLAIRLLGREYAVHPLLSQY